MEDICRIIDIAVEESSPSLYDKLKTLDKKIDFLNIKFFNKSWKCKLLCGLKSINMEDLAKLDPSVASTLRKFIAKSSNVSKELEEKFCEIATTYGRDFTTPLVFESYSDFKELKITSIGIDTKFKSNEFCIMLRGEYDADPEHGWSLKFTPDCHWIGGLGQHSDGF